MIAELRSRHGGGVARPPSVRTMQRWYHERRWLTKAAAERSVTIVDGVPVERHGWARREDRGGSKRPVRGSEGDMPIGGSSNRQLADTPKPPNTAERYRAPPTRLLIGLELASTLCADHWGQPNSSHATDTHGRQAAPRGAPCSQLVEAEHERDVSEQCDGNAGSTMPAANSPPSLLRRFAASPTASTPAANAATASEPAGAAPIWMPFGLRTA